MYYAPIGVYEVRRACTTASIIKIWNQLALIKSGSVDIGQSARGHSSRTAVEHYDK